MTGLVAGALVGVLPALNWIANYYETGDRLHKLRPPWLTFYGRWFSEPLGLGPDHTLGPIEFTRFVAWPLIGDSRLTWSSSSTSSSPRLQSVCWLGPRFVSIDPAF